MSDALIFEAVGQSFALPLEDVREVLRAALPLSVPRAPYACLGLLDVRGQMVPVVDLAAMLGLRGARELKTFAEQLVNSHLLLLERSPLPVALVVDRVLEVGQAQPASAEELAAAQASLGRAGGLIAGVVEASGRRALLLRADAVVTTSRMRLLGRMAARVGTEAIQ